MDTNYDIKDLLSDCVPHLSKIDVVSLSLIGNRYHNIIFTITSLANPQVPDINSFNQITELYIDSSSKLKNISKLTSLTNLTLHYNNDIQTINTLTNLTYLNLDHNHIVSDISNLVKLTTLSISWTKKVVTLDTLTNLKYLDLRYNKMIYNIEKLIGLTELYVMGKIHLSSLKLPPQNINIKNHFV